MDQDLFALMEVEDDKRGDGTSIAGTLVRLAWHASGTYSKVTCSGVRLVPLCHEGNEGYSTVLKEANVFFFRVHTVHAFLNG